MIVTLVSVLVATLLFLLAIGVTSLYGERKTDLDILIESSIYTRIATAFVAVVTAPLVEELVYRGLLYRTLEKAAGMGVAIAHRVAAVCGRSRFSVPQQYRCNRCHHAAEHHVDGVASGYG